MPELNFYVDQLITFTLVLVRVSTLVMLAPIYGTAEVPARIRALLAVALAALVVPLQWTHMSQLPQTLVDLMILVGAEALIGLTLGLGILVLFSGMQVAGQIISQMSGMQLADVISPGLDNSVPVVSHLLYSVALAVFVILGGHRQVMGALLDTFEWLPLGQTNSFHTIPEAMTILLSQSFSLGVRAAAPAVAALLLATLILGFVGRTLPQLNVMTIGFGLSAGVTLATLSISLSGAAWIFQEQVEPVLETVLSAFRP